MKKRFFSFILAICLIIPCMFAIVGCGGNPATLTKEDYIKVFNGFADTLATSVEGQVATTAGVNIPDSDFVDANNNTQAKTMSKVCRATIMFVRNIYAREDYVLKTSYEDCFVVDESNPGNPYTMDMRMKTVYNSETSVVTTEIYIEYEINSTAYVQYFVFDIEYDFSAEKVESFSISGFDGRKENQTADGVEYFKFKNNEFKKLSHEAESFASFAAQVFTNIDTLRTPARATSPADYTVEYTDACRYVV